MQFESTHDGGRFGPLRSDESPGGRLVSLLDVMKWLTTKRELPWFPALESMLVALAGDDRVQLFECRPGLYALPISAESRVLRDWDLFDTGIDESLAGKPAVVALLRYVLGEHATATALEDGAYRELRCGGLAMASADAQRLFRFGVEADHGLPDALLPGQLKWTDDACAELLSRHEAMKAAGRAHPTKDLAAQYGVSDSLIREKLRRARKTRPSAPAASVVATGAAASVFHYADAKKRRGAS